MATGARGFKDFKKQPFLKAFVRFGKVWPAARATRISRDLVYDWLRRDPAFRQHFHDARVIFHSAANAQLSQHLDFFCAAAKPAIPPALWPSVSTAVNLALMRHPINKDGRQSAAVLSRKPFRYPSPASSHGLAAVEIGDGPRTAPPTS